MLKTTASKLQLFNANTGLTVAADPQFSCQLLRHYLDLNPRNIFSISATGLTILSTIKQTLCFNYRRRRGRK